MGAKKQPLHALVSHGSVGVGGPSPPPLDLQGLTSWFQESREGGVEGIVWHCDDGTLVKVSEHPPNSEPQLSAFLDLPQGRNLLMYKCAKMCENGL